MHEQERGELEGLSPKKLGMTSFHLDSKCNSVTLTCPMKISDSQKINAVSAQMGGVFTLGDLEILLTTSNRKTLFNRLNRLKEAGTLSQFMRGFYVTQGFSGDMLCGRIDPNAYISMGTILSRNGLIGTMPSREVSAVKVGRKRSYQGAGLTINYAGTSEQATFGITKKNGINYADNEKAYIDTMYYYLRGYRYAFDPFEIYIDDLDRKKCARYLSYYKNKKFSSFVNTLLQGTS